LFGETGLASRRLFFDGHLWFDLLKLLGVGVVITVLAYVVKDTRLVLFRGTVHKQFSLIMPLFSFPVPLLSECTEVSRLGASERRSLPLDVLFGQMPRPPRTNVPPRESAQMWPWFYHRNR
jgi:hypothetical protein